MELMRSHQTHLSLNVWLSGNGGGGKEGEHARRVGDVRMASEAIKERVLFYDTNLNSYNFIIPMRF